MIITNILIQSILLTTQIINTWDIDYTSPKAITYMAAQTYQTLNNNPSLTYDPNFQQSCNPTCCITTACQQQRNSNGDQIRNTEDIVVIFGGLLQTDSQKTSGEYTLSNLLQFYNIQQKKLVEYQDSQSIVNNPSLYPSARMGQASKIAEIKDSNNLVRKYLYIHGGINNGVYSDELWQYELPFASMNYYPSTNDSGNKWTLLGRSEIKRAFHSMFYYSNKLYLYGGHDESSFKDDMWSFDLNSKKWGQVEYKGILSISRTIRLWDGTTYSEIIKNSQKMIRGFDKIQDSKITVNKAQCQYQINPKLEVPKCRGFMATTQNENEVYLFGGMGINKEYFGDLWKLDLKTLYFEQIFQRDEKYLMNVQWPGARQGAQMDLSSQDSSIFMYGGEEKGVTLAQLWQYRYQLVQSQSINQWYLGRHDHFYTYKNGSNEQKPLIGHSLLKYSKGYVLIGGIESNFTSSSSFTASSTTTINDIQIVQQANTVVIKVNQKRTISNKQIKVFRRDDHCDPRYLKRSKKCYYGRLECISQYYGPQCQYIQCPQSFCYYVQNSIVAASCFFCSKQGECNGTTGKCKCDARFTNENKGCIYGQCQNGCSQSKDSNAGICKEQFPNSQCDCNATQKRGGDSCEQIFCLNDCTNNGKCVNGQCQDCNKGWTGPDCSIYQIDIMEL